MSRKPLYGVVFLALMAGAVPPPVQAASSDDSDQLTVRVDPGLGITDESGHITLVFDGTTGTETGSVSTGNTVTYTIQSNTMPNSALAGALSARISQAINGVSLKAFPGDYINDGASNNAMLNKVGNEVVIGTAATAVYDKPVSPGTAGRVLQGRAPIHYRAVATRDLTSADGGTVSLTVTLKDA